MYLEVQPSGKKVWRMKFRHQGKESRVTFGEYPAISLQDARQAREEHRRRLREEGVSPAQHKKQQEALRRTAAASSFKALGDEWFQATAGKRAETTNKLIQSRIEDNLYPFLGDRPIAEISPQELLGVLKKVQARGALVVAKKLRQYASSIFRFAMYDGRGKADPASALSGALKTKKERHHAAIVDPRQLVAYCEPSKGIVPLLSSAPHSRSRR